MKKEVPADSSLLKALEVIVNSQLLVENLEDLKDITMYNKQKVKQLSNQLIKELSKVCEKDYNAIFGIDEQLTLNIAYEYDKIVKRIAAKNIMQVIESSQMEEAYGYDRSTMEATAHRIIKKHAK